jgi:hypothetical protein
MKRMKNPNVIDTTLDLLYEMDLQGLPEKDQFLYAEPGEEHDRFVVIGEEVLGDELISRGFGGCWPLLDDALESYDWNAGAPAFVIDLFVEPRRALIDVVMKASPRKADGYVARRSLVDDAGELEFPS